jgi:hypothetical protein
MMTETMFFGDGSLGCEIEKINSPQICGENEQKIEYP